MCDGAAALGTWGAIPPPSSEEHAKRTLEPALRKVRSRSIHLAKLLAPDGGRSLLRDMNSLRQENGATVDT